jgi:Holliday junction resolvase RusA-like endonuclease
MRATKYRRGYIGTARILGDRATDSAPNVEQAACDEPIQAGRRAAFDSRVDIRIVSYRTRLADADGISAKAAIDGLVHAGVIRDDSTKEVREVSYCQIKVKNKNEEKTVIQIRRVSE